MLSEWLELKLILLKNLLKEFDFSVWPESSEPLDFIEKALSPLATAQLVLGIIIAF